MALGDMTVANNNKKNYSPVLYSAYKFSNAESVVDQTILTPTFWNGMLKLAISPRKNTGNTEEVSWDHDNAIAMYLSHIKARLLYNEVCKFQQDMNAFNNVGVPSGAGLISISNGKEFGINNPCLVIRKLDAQTGQVESSIAYQFKYDYHYSIRNFEEKTSDFDKIYDNNLELEMFKDLLKGYYEAQSGAVAYSVIDAMKFDMSRLNTKLTAVGEKLGVEMGGGYKNNQSKSSSSIFNNKEPRNNNFSMGTISDIDNM
ncbi:MAG: hypothetical protein ACRDD7_01470 [Peptostreptococcaceae bacterium]